MKKTLKVFGLCTSARGKNSNTYMLMKKAFDELKGDNLEKSIIVASELNLVPCQHHYSMDAKMCVHPCHITQNNPSDQMKIIYDEILDSDVIIFSTPIHWGNRSQLMQLVIERLNSLENQNSVFKNPIVKNKIGGIMVVGHEDGYQQVVGGLMSFMTELGLIFPPQAYASWVGESNEQTRTDKKRLEDDKEIQAEFNDLAQNCVDFAQKILHPATNGKKFDYVHVSRRKI